MFVFGGHDGTEALNDLHVLLTLTWGRIPDLGQSPPHRAGHTVSGKRPVDFRSNLIWNSPSVDFSKMDY